MLLLSEPSLLILHQHRIVNSDLFADRVRVQIGVCETLPQSVTCSFRTQKDILFIIIVIASLVLRSHHLLFKGIRRSILLYPLQMGLVLLLLSHLLNGAILKSRLDLLVILTRKGFFQLFLPLLFHGFVETSRLNVPVQQLVLKLQLFLPSLNRADLLVQRLFGQFLVHGPLELFLA